MGKGRDRRIADELRVKGKARRILRGRSGGEALAKDGKYVGRMAHTPHPCSCLCCGNPRRKGKGCGALTMQERRALGKVPDRVDEGV